MVLEEGKHLNEPLYSRKITERCINLIKGSSMLMLHYFNHMYLHYFNRDGDRTKTIHLIVSKTQNLSQWFSCHNEFV